jgi:hypothetical protein
MLVPRLDALRARYAEAGCPLQLGTVLREPTSQMLSEHLYFRVPVVKALVHNASAQQDDLVTHWLPGRANPQLAWLRNRRCTYHGAIFLCTTPPNTPCGDSVLVPLVAAAPPNGHTNGTSLVSSTKDENEDAHGGSIGPSSAPHRSNAVRGATGSNRGRSLGQHSTSEASREHALEWTAEEWTAEELNATESAVELLRLFDVVGTADRVGELLWSLAARAGVLLDEATLRSKPSSKQPSSKQQSLPSHAPLTSTLTNTRGANAPTSGASHPSSAAASRRDDHSRFEHGLEHGHRTGQPTGLHFGWCPLQSLVCFLIVFEGSDCDWGC